MICFEQEEEAAAMALGIEEENTCLTELPFSSRVVWDKLTESNPELQMPCAVGDGFLPMSFQSK